jgi:hypothetical protein
MLWAILAVSVAHLVLNLVWSAWSFVKLRHLRLESEEREQEERRAHEARMEALGALGAPRDVLRVLGELPRGENRR